MNTSAIAALLLLFSTPVGAIAPVKNDVRASKVPDGPAHVQQPGNAMNSIKGEPVAGHAPGGGAGGSIDKPTSATLLQSQSAWNGTPYVAYPAGRPQLTMLKIIIPPHSVLPWHTHVVPNAAYVLTGRLTVEDRATGERHVINAGDAMAESVDVEHRGVTGEEGAELIVVYAATAATPLSIPSEGEKPEFGG
jgi:quercetin dioxygenase-like cupin family protein